MVLLAGMILGRIVVDPPHEDHPATYAEGSINHWLDSFYFGIISMTTIGYGDFTPTTTLTKLLVMLYLIFKAGFAGDDVEYDERNAQGIEYFGLYWHFVDLAWVVIFPAFYLY